MVNAGCQIALSEPSGDECFEAIDVTTIKTHKAAVDLQSYAIGSLGSLRYNYSKGRSNGKAESLSFGIKMEIN